MQLTILLTQLVVAFFTVVAVLTAYLSATDRKWGRFAGAVVVILLCCISMSWLNHAFDDLEKEHKAERTEECEAAGGKYLPINDVCLPRGNN